jgi:hypothetical protein
MSNLEILLQVNSSEYLFIRSYILCQDQVIWLVDGTRPFGFHRHCVERALLRGLPVSLTLQVGKLVLTLIVLERFRDMGFDISSCNDLSYHGSAKRIVRGVASNKM